MDFKDLTKKINNMSDEDLLIEWDRFKNGTNVNAIYTGDITVFEYCQTIYSEISSRGLKIR